MSSNFNRIQLKRYTYFQQEQYKPVLDADGNPVLNPDTNEAELELVEDAEQYYGNFFPVEVEPTTYETGLYIVDYNTQVPGKFKLWKANDYWLKISSATQQIVTSPLIFRSNTNGTQISINGNDIELFTNSYSGGGRGLYKGLEIVSEVPNDNKFYVKKFQSWIDLHTFVIQSVGTATDKWMSQNATKLEFDKHIARDGRKSMIGGFVCAPDKYWGLNNQFGIDARNSDIIGIHSLYFQDLVDADNEGINFPRTNGNYDNIAALNGELYFTVNVPKSNTTVRLQHKVLTALNYNTLVPKLDGTGATGNWNINAASAKKLDHNLTINLTDTDNKNGVTGTVTTDLSGTTINIATELSPFDASKIVSGIIDIDRLPQGVLERLVPVANRAARLALTKAQVQNGDTVKQIDTQEMWYVADDTKLNQDAGYEVYTSGRASSVPWTGVENKPTQITLTTDLSGVLALSAGALNFAATIVNGAVTNAKLADMSANTIKGRQSTAGDPQDLSPAQIRSMLNIADGANNYTHPSHPSRTTGFYKFNVDGEGHVTGVTGVLKSDITGLGIPDTDTTYSVFGRGTNGLTPAPGGSTTTRYLREDGSWAIPPDTNTTYGTFGRGTSGLTPAPGGSTSNRYLREDGSWVIPPDTNTTYGLATTSSEGLLRQLNNSTTNFLRGDGIWAAIPSVDLSGYVTIGGAQSITGKKTMTAISIGGVTFEHNGGEVGVVCLNYNSKHIHLRPAGESTLDGSLYVAGGGYGSDIRFKTDFREVDTSKANEIKLHTFYNKRIKQVSGGVVAQEIEKLYPEAVFVDTNSNEKYKYVDYNYVFSVLHENHRKEIQAIKDRGINQIELKSLSIRSLVKLILLKILKIV